MKRGKIGEGVVRCWPPNELVFPLGFLRLCQIWWKSIKKCGRESSRRRTDTDTLTDANRFYNLSHAICYGCETDKDTKTQNNGSQEKNYYLVRLLTTQQIENTKLHTAVSRLNFCNILFVSSRLMYAVNYTVSQKTCCCIFAITSSTVNQFRKFFHCWIQR